MSDQKKPKIFENVSIKSYTTFKVGGVVRYLTEVCTPEEFVEAVKYAKTLKMPHYVLAGGSNVVFKDGLLDIFVIKLVTPEIWLSDGSLKPDISRCIKNRELEIACDGAVKLADLIKFSLDLGLAGLETLSGIPGTVAGAIVGNAGAYGHNISEPLVEVLVFDGESTYWVKKEDCNFVYRDSIFKYSGQLVLSALFKFERGTKTELIKRSEDIILTRERKYAPELLCPGSFFKNVLVSDVSSDILTTIDQSKIIEGKIPAGYLLEQVGAKGMKCGGVCVTDFHGNLLVNDGTATFENVWELANDLRQLVKERFGIALEEEVRYIG